jgi:hypothetical protein
MNILSDAIVSNSDMIKNYKTCRDKAELYGNIFILKNNQPDAVLFSISKYERLANLIEYVESHKVTDIAKIISLMPKEKEVVV